ncbi:phosphoglycerate kinase [Micromonospora humida]|uniref:Phosphoglycerate kinase n=1 Tax=Micromonospora humida TaxID=2809018 RepID=A0ABS2IMF3_9ACTN|nr:phosphoglycerate kinase [Micromonospora humida]MBM7075537.1 phosphoglycerate kinase [Micromonospora humida]
MPDHETTPAAWWDTFVPPVGSLQTLDGLGSQVRGRRVLIAADIDVARRQTSSESHFKIERLARTVRRLVNNDATVLILGTQGSNSVRVLEPGNTQGLEWHRQAMERVLPGTGVARFDAMDDALSADLEPGTVTLLPNLAEVSREDTAFATNYAPPGDAEAEMVRQQACERALLPTLLRDRFDVFVLDDFRSAVWMLPSNVGLAAGKPCAVGLGLQEDLESLVRLVEHSRALREAGKLGRICYVGSSRPQDVATACILLANGLFDRALLGPMPSLMVYRELGFALGAGPAADLESLLQTHRPIEVAAGRDISDLINRHLSDLALPTDYLVANRTGYGKSRRVTPEGLEALADDDRIMSIGPETLKKFAAETKRARLVFHFGMMSARHRPYVSYTEEVIRTNLTSSAPSYMAGDHILEIADDLGLSSALRGRTTGAQTGSSVLCGVPMPGLAPFRIPGDAMTTPAS